MSLKDVKEAIETINISGIDYKIVYNHNAISDVEELFGVNTFDCCMKLADDELGKLKDRLDFCLIGFKKYHPDITLEILDEAGNYQVLFNTCRNLFLERNFQPEIFKTLALKDEAEKKKIMIAHEELTGQIIYLSRKFSEYQKKNSGKIMTLVNCLLSGINTVLSRVGLKR